MKKKSVKEEPDKCSTAGYAQKTIGLIGGMSWESSAEYYRIINQTVQKEIGCLHSARIIMYSFDLDEIERRQREGEWAELTNMMIAAAYKLEKAGADAIVICTNTMHVVADEVQASVNIPLINIIDVTAKRVLARQLETVGLLGTKYTMEEDFYKGRLAEKYGLKVLVPGAEDRRFVHGVIFGELCKGKIKKASRERFKEIIADLARDGAEGVILGCTELPLLVKPKDTLTSLFDTTEIHARAAAAFALGN